MIIIHEIKPNKLRKVLITVGTIKLHYAKGNHKIVRCAIISDLRLKRNKTEGFMPEVGRTHARRLYGNCTTSGSEESRWSGCVCEIYRMQNQFSIRRRLRRRDYVRAAPRLSPRRWWMPFVQVGRGFGERGSREAFRVGDNGSRFGQGGCFMWSDGTKGWDGVEGRVLHWPGTTVERKKDLTITNGLRHVPCEILYPSLFRFAFTLHMVRM